MKKKILNNLGLKLISIVIAFVLWFLVVMADNPKASVSFSNIQVNLVNTELLEKENKVYEILDNSDVVRVTVEAPRNIINEISASDIVAEADVSKLTEVNTIAISYHLLNDDVEILGISGNHDVVRLNVEDKASNWIDVRCNPVGEVAEGYMISGTTSDQTRIEVSGPKSAVESISYAKLEIDVSGATTKQIAYVDVLLYDADDNLLDLPSVTKNVDIMRVEVQVLATKEVPVNVSPIGNPAEGYLATGVVECDPPTVMIAGPSYALANVNAITIPEERLDITDKDSNWVGVINIGEYLPENTSLADGGFNGRITVTVYIEPEVERTLLIPETNITVQNLPEGFRAEFAENASSYRLRISGLDAAVSAIDQNAVQGILDIGKWMERHGISELAAGTYDIPLSFQLPDNVQIENEVMVKLSIVEGEDEN